VRFPALPSAARPLLLVAVLLTAACEPPPAAIETGLPVPDFTARSVEGEAVSLASLRGEVVLLNIWATWCYPCRKEMPSFEALHRELAPEGLRVVAVSIDVPGAQPEIESFLDEHAISFAVLHDGDQKITRTFRTMGVPETFLIGRDGRLLRRWIGRIDGHSPAVRQPILDALHAS
jgi:cytochrome c biogenesis protein CcmG, thiol:disulfide interchange protein DsbE